MLGRASNVRKSKGEGDHTENPFCRGGMDIFWNHTMALKVVVTLQAKW